MNNTPSLDVEFKTVIDHNENIYSIGDDFALANIPVKDIKGHFWAEVDFIEDYRRILDYVSEKTGIKTNGSIITPDHR